MEGVTTEKQNQMLHQRRREHQKNQNLFEKKPNVTVSFCVKIDLKNRFKNVPRSSQEGPRGCPRTSPGPPGARLSPVFRKESEKGGKMTISGRSRGRPGNPKFMKKCVEKTFKKRCPQKTTYFCDFCDFREFQYTFSWISGLKMCVRKAFLRVFFRTAVRDRI